MDGVKLEKGRKACGRIKIDKNAVQCDGPEDRLGRNRDAKCAYTDTHSYSCQTAFEQIRPGCELGAEIFQMIPDISECTTTSVKRVYRVGTVCDFRTAAKYPPPNASYVAIAGYKKLAVVTRRPAWSRR